MVWFLFIAAGFLSGSVMYCQTVPKLLLKTDVAAMSDDNNPGAFNAFAHCGKKIGLFCLLADVLKGFIPVFVSCFFVNVSSMLFSLVMVSPVLGHAFGAFNRFRGGKCIAVSFGVAFGVLPVTRVGLTVLAVLYVLFSTVAKINPNRIRSIVVYCLFAVISCTVCAVIGKASAAVGCVNVALIVIAKHLKIAESLKRRFSRIEK